MPKGFFEDMVRVKRASQSSGQTQGQTPVQPPANISDKPPAKAHSKAPIKITAHNSSRIPAKKPVAVDFKPVPLPAPPKPPRREPVLEEIKIDKARPREIASENTQFASVYDLPREDRGGERTSKGIWALAGVCVLVFLFAISFLFSEAKVILEPKSADLALNKNFFAAKGGLTNDLSFDLVVVSGEEKKTVTGTEEKQVTKAAEGLVIIYNDYSAATQRLDINTRLEGSNGKIYKTVKAVVVPGKTSDGTPGSVEVGIYAVEPGDSYNSGPLDFTIYGFRGTSKYSKFFARSTGDITKGFQGVSKTLGEKEKQEIFDQMKQNLENMLFQKVEGSIPAGFILFDGATSLVIDGEFSEPVAGSTEEITLSLKGTLYGFLLDEAKLTKKIAETSAENYDGAEVYIPNIKNLSFAISNQDALSFKDTNNMTFNIAGSGQLVWKLEEDKIVLDLIGRRKKEFASVLSGYPSVQTGSVSLSPFWRRSFPDKEKDIKLIVNYPK